MVLRRCVAGRHFLLGIALTLVATCCAAQDAVPQQARATSETATIDPPAQSSTPASMRAASLRRPALLVPLYTSYAGLNALDCHSSRRALSQGSAREANPVARTLGSGALLIAAKAAVTTGVIVASEKMRKKHPKRAVLLVSALDAMMVVVVAHNYSLHPNN
jgi:hypothetical protein